MVYNTYFNNDDASEFFINFVTGGREYTYELVADRKSVISEVLKDKKAVILCREYNRITRSLTAQKIDIPLRKNASVLSTLRQYGVQEVQRFTDFFSRFMSNVSYTGLNPVFGVMFNMHKWYNDNPNDFTAMKDKIRAFDTGIGDIRIRRAIDERGRAVYIPAFYHTTNEGNSLLEIDFESSGTKWLYNNLFLISRTIQTGGVLIMDEIDQNLHGDILPLLIGDFVNPHKNQKGAQILFTTNNDSIMELLKKYQICLSQ